MALLRQNGCPSIFLTLSCAEFDWPELAKEIAETVYKREFSEEEIESMSDQEKNKLISENVVQSTLHFQKRIEKMYALMGYDFFESESEVYHVSSYFFRVEFQQRGAPHIHSLLWLKNKDGKDAPNFWFDSENETEADQGKNHKNRIEEIEKFADLLITTSPEEIKCKEHQLNNDKTKEEVSCTECINLQDKVSKYQNHMHTFTCAKKKKTLTKVITQPMY